MRRYHRLLTARARLRNARTHFRKTGYKEIVADLDEVLRKAEEILALEAVTASLAKEDGDGEAGP